MANGLYTTFKVGLLTKVHNLGSDSVKALLQRSSAYTANLSTDHFVSTVTSGGAEAARSAALGSPTTTSGTFNTAGFTWTAVGAGAACQQIILENDTVGGADASRPLICYYDTGMTGMPVTPNGGDINVTVNASGWFSL